MGPPVAALAGIGVLALYDEWRIGEGRGYLPLTLILTASWEAYIVAQYPGLRERLLPVLGAGTLVAVVGLVGPSRFGALKGSALWIKACTSIGLTTLLIGPACWSVAPVLAPANSMMPTAEPTSARGQGGGPGMSPMPPFGRELQNHEKLISLLRANRRDERIFLAAPSSMEVAPIIIQTGEPAISLGGFMGADPILSKEAFARLVRVGQVRFVMAGGGGPGGGPPVGGMPFPPGGLPGGMPFPPGGPPGFGNSEIMTWVREHGKPVDARLWKPEEPADTRKTDEEAGRPDGPGYGPMRMFRRLRGMAQLYDCKPEQGLIVPSPASR